MPTSTDLYESLLLGAIFRDPECLYTPGMNEDLFQRYGYIYRAVQSVAKSNQDPGLLNVAAVAGEQHLGTIGGIIQNAGVPKNAKIYVEQLTKAYTLRRVKEIAQEILNDPEGDPAKLIGSALTSFMKLGSSDKSSRSLNESLCEAIEHLDLIRERREAGKAVGVPTGVPKLDIKTGGGGHPTELIIVAARPKMGKTSFALKWATNALRNGFTVGFVSTEMSYRQLTNRLLSAESGVPYDKFYLGDLTEEESRKTMKASAALSDLPLNVIDSASITVGEISVYANSWKMKTGLDILFVDYLTRLKPETKTERHDLAVTEICKDLKALAKQLDIPVVCLAQLNRELEKRTDKRPLPSDLRDSGGVEQELDKLFMLYRPWIYDKKQPTYDAEILVPMNRHGDTGIVRAIFQPETNTWKDRALHRMETEV